jgi:hypothetical protein
MTTKAPRVGKISETIHARNGLFCKVLCNIDIPQYDQRKKREGVVMEKKKLLKTCGVVSIILTATMNIREVLPKFQKTL